MRKIFVLLIFSFLLPYIMYGQNVPNGGFETWTNGNPDSWYADNVPPVAFPVIQSTAHSGSFSAKGIVVNTLGGLLPPLIQSDLSVVGFPISQRYKTVTGYYQFSPVQGDKFNANFMMYNNGVQIAEGKFEIIATATSWAQFSVDFSYTAPDIPDKCFLQFYIDGPNSSSDFHAGSFFLIDDLNLTGTATSVNNDKLIPDDYSLEQNYPNPFNPSTKIIYYLPANSFVSIKIYNAIGLEVRSLINNIVPAGPHEVVFDAANLNSGVYFYTMKAGNNFVQTRKMILMK